MYILLFKMLAGDGERLSSFEATTSGGCSVWFLVVIPFLLRNLRELNTTANNQNQDKISFLLSCLFGTLDGSDLMKQNCSSNVSRRIYDRLVGLTPGSTSAFKIQPAKHLCDPCGVVYIILFPRVV